MNSSLCDFSKKVWTKLTGSTLTQCKLPHRPLLGAPASISVHLDLNKSYILLPHQLLFPSLKDEKLAIFMVLHHYWPFVFKNNQHRGWHSIWPDFMNTKARRCSNCCTFESFVWKAFGVSCLVSRLAWEEKLLKTTIYGGLKLPWTFFFFFFCLKPSGAGEFQKKWKLS